MGKFSIRRSVALAAVAMYVMAGSHGSVRAEGKRECEELQYTVEFSVNEEYLREFKDTINGVYNGGMTQELFMDVFTALNEIARVNMRRAVVRILNNEKVSIDDLEDYSSYCENETDRREIRENIVRNVNLYNIMYTENGNLSELDEFMPRFVADVEALEAKEACLTAGGLWLSNNSGYTAIKEVWNIYTERRMAIDKEFKDELFKYCDEEIYNKTNKFVLREGMEEVLNNAECLSPVEAWIDICLEISNRIKNANRMIPVLMPTDCNNAVGSLCVYDGVGNTIYVFPSQEESHKGRVA